MSRMTAMVVAGALALHLFGGIARAEMTVGYGWVTAANLVT